jgi:Na+/melibiose symporter-like transporter
VLAQSCLQQFFRPAEQSLVPHLVDPQQLVTANALNSQSNDIARLTGAALGGVLAAAGGLPLLAVVDAATYLLAMGLLYGVKHRAVAVVRERTSGAVQRLKAEWMDGLRICLSSKAMRIVFVFGLVTGVGEGAMSTLFAPFVSSELGGDGTAYGLIVSAQAVGGIVGGLVAAAVGARFAAAKLWGVGAVLFGLIDLALFCYPLFYDGLTPAYVLMIAVGLPGAFVVAASMTVVQRLTDDASRGRVFGALFAAEGLAVLVGIVASGLLGEVVGIIPVLIFQGLGFTVGGLVVLARSRLLEEKAPALVDVS